MPKSNRTRARLPQSKGGNGAPGKEDRVSKRPVEAIVVPRVEEQIQIHKKKRATGRVEVRVVPHVRTESVDLVLEQEEVEIKRVPVNRVVDAPAAIRQEGDVTI